MTSPFTTVRPAEEVMGERKYVPMARTRGKLMIVRPLEYQATGFVTTHKPEGTDVVFCDIAVLDAIPAATDEYGEPLPGFAAGEQFRRQSVLQGYLKGTFKRYIGGTLIGTIYFGPREKGKPPMMWQDLSADAACVQRGQQFLMEHREFLVPVEAAFAPAVAEVPAGPAPYVAPVPAQQHPYAQPDPYQQPVVPAAAPASAPVAGPVYQQPQADAGQPLTTLQQLRAANQVNHLGQPQSEQVPF